MLQPHRGRAPRGQQAREIWLLTSWPTRLSGPSGTLRRRRPSIEAQVHAAEDGRLDPVLVGQVRLQALLIRWFIMCCHSLRTQHNMHIVLVESLPVTSGCFTMVFGSYVIFHLDCPW